MVFGLATDELKIKVGTEKDCVQPVSVEWPAAKVKEQIEVAFKSVQNQAKVPGFRPGKAPLDMVRKQFAETAYARAQDNMMREGVTEAIKAKKINAIQTPMILNAKFDPEKSFQFDFQVEVAPTFKLANHTGIKLTKTVKTVTDESLNKTLNQIAESNAQLIESKAESLTSTHYAVVDYEGSIDGKTLEGGKAENFLIDMSAPQTIAGMAEGLVGMKPSETKDVDVTFPESSPAKELAGKKAIFKVTLKTIKEKQLPVLNDDFAKDLGLTSIEELKKKVRDNMQSEIDLALKRDLNKQVTEALLNENKFSVPASLLEEQVKYLENRQRQNLARQGISVEDQTKVLTGAKAELQKQAEKDVRIAYILNEIDPSIYDFLKPIQWMQPILFWSAFALVASQFIFLFNFIHSLFFGEKSVPNPWQSGTLAWTTSSPPIPHNFEVTPTVYCGPHEFSVPGLDQEDWIAQNDPVGANLGKS